MQKITLGPQLDRIRGESGYQNPEGESHMEKVTLTYNLWSRDSQGRSQGSRNYYFLPSHQSTAKNPHWSTPTRSQRVWKLWYIQVTLQMQVQGEG